MNYLFYGAKFRSKIFAHKKLVSKWSLLGLIVKKSFKNHIEPFFFLVSTMGRVIRG